MNVHLFRFDRADKALEMNYLEDDEEALEKFGDLDDASDGINFTTMVSLLNTSSE